MVDMLQHGLFKEVCHYHRIMPSSSSCCWEGCSSVVTCIHKPLNTSADRKGAKEARYNCADWLLQCQQMLIKSVCRWGNSCVPLQV